MCRFIWWLVCILVLQSVSGGKMSNPLVKINQGTLKGSLKNLLDGTPYYSFKGIPYAQVPARFLAPEPPSPFQGVYDATKHGPVCTQYDMTLKQYMEGDENCLFLNIYSKSLQPDAKIPVMVFIHGGAYMSGSGDAQFGFGPEWLLQHDVILVTINYRLEALGFLCLDTPEVPGNAAMRDQVAALRWVQQNIAQFGGDPDNVTLFGESAGSTSVNFHMQSPMSKGLFKKAIAQSGANIVDWGLGRNGKERAFRLARYLGNNSTDTAEVLRFLRSVSAIKLAKLTFRTMTDDEKRRGLPIHFGPVVEKKFNGVEPFITEEPLEALVSGRLNKVPLMVGYNSDEALLMLEDALRKIDFTNRNVKFLVPREIAQKISEEKQSELGERIKKFYVGDRDFTQDDAKLIADMLSDIHFVYSIHRYVNFYSDKAPTYLYRFSCDTELNVVKNLSSLSNMTGAIHADELFYLFYSELNKDPYEEKQELRDLVFKVTKLWADFAKNSNPTPDPAEVKWPQYTTSNRSYLEINDKKFSVKQYADKARVDFWNKIYCDSGLPCITKSNL